MDWPHFSEEEMRCRCGCGRADMDREFMRALEMLREVVAFPMPVTSGFRCPAHDAAVGGSERKGAGPHTTGKAADILVSGERAYRLVRAALELGFRGIGLKQRGPQEGRFVHLDMLGKEEAARPRIWTY